MSDSKYKENYSREDIRGAINWVRKHCKEKHQLREMSNDTGI